MYVQKTFNNLLPHPRTLRRWFMVVDGSPGFTKESFDALSKEASNRPVYVNLVIDEMCIRQQVEMDSQRNIYGYINMGADHPYDSDNIPLAKNALVYLAVGINGYWKIPIAYFLIDGLGGKERSNLLKEAIHLLHDTGVKLKSITFDGASVNTKMCTELGANFNLQNNKAYIIDREKIVIYLDPAHMLKLIRNAWEHRNNIKNSKNETIDWNFIKKLYDLEKEQGLRAGTKLTKRHINFHNEKMNVRLAAQTLSQSVSDTLRYLTLTNEEYKEAGPASEFIAYVNKAFDILNSRSRFSKSPFKRAISDCTINEYSLFITDFTMYIKGLQFSDGVKIVDSGRKTGFVGFILGLQNAIEMYKSLREEGNLTFFLTYKISQDFIETTFSAFRSRLGYNNNPTCQQFKAAYKRILVHNEAVGSIFGNCSILDNTKNLIAGVVDSKKKKIWF